MISLAGLTPALALGIVIVLLLSGVLVTLIRSRPALKKIAADREANLLHERATEMDSMRERLAVLEAKLEQKDQDHDRERRIERHRFNNLDSAFNALLLLLKQGVAVEDAVSAVEKMRAEQLARETVEKSTLRAGPAK